ncbi:MAG: Minf_1886 family protein [Phycisphaerae bacterium]
MAFNIRAMPPEAPELKPLEDIVADDGRYPMDAFLFVQEGLSRTVQQLQRAAEEDPARRHVSGAELACGLRDFAVDRWGFLAGTVLRSWNLRTTRDFGEIVFLLVDNGYLQKTEGDAVEDFDDVFCFTDFDKGYRIKANA